MFHFKWRVRQELMLKLRKLVQPWLDSFSVEDEKLWNKWIEYYCVNNGQGLTELFFTGVNEKFKAKALIILLTPDFEFLPFNVQCRNDSQNSFSELRLLGWKKYLPLETGGLKSLAVDLISLFSFYFRANKKIFGEDFQDESLLSYYNDVIKKIIVNFSLGEIKGKKLLNMYDCFAVAEKDDASPAVIFRNFLEDPIIPNDWKIEFEKKCRPLIKQSLANDNERRLSKEDYITSFDLQVEKAQIKDLPYSVVLFMSQLQAVIELGFFNINPRIVLKILEIVKFHRPREVLKIANAVIPFMRRLYCKDDLSISEEILGVLRSEFLQADNPWILERLWKKVGIARKYLVEQPAARQTEHDRAKKKLEEKKKEILSQMCS